MITANDVKRFILDPDPAVRQFAVDYFHHSYSKDPEIMPLVLESCQRYPEEESRVRLLADSFEFQQTPETVQAILNYVQEDRRNRDTYEQILTNCDLELIQSAHLSLKDLLPYSQKVIERRLAAATQPSAELWQELLNHSAAAADTEPHLYDFNLGVIYLKELATRSDFPASKVMERLKFPYSANYQGYDEIYMAMLAGELRLIEALPVLFNKLAAVEQPLLTKAAHEAIVKIGTEEAVQVIASRFPSANHQLRGALSAILGQIKLPSAEKLAIQLLEQELSEPSVSGNGEGSPDEENASVCEEYSHLTVATHLAKALCSLLSADGIPLVQKLIAQGYDPEVTMLEQDLYACCRITGINLPELADYQRMIEEERESYRRAKFSTFMSFLNKDVKIGRNDPCPCGSGKKYKKCCGR